MKKYLLNLLLLVAFALPFATQAQVNLTVHDGTTTNTYVPIYGLYVDAYLNCQMVYPASELVQMTGGQISGLTFYASSAGTWSGSQFQVYLTEVPSTSISSFVPLSSCTQVYEGPLSAASTLNITFDDAYTYQGGNLLVAVVNATIGTYSSCSWYGETVTGACVQGYSYSSLSACSTNQRNFLPKTTFSYAPGDSSCPFVSNFHYDNLTARSVDLSWTAGGSESEWEIAISPAIDDISVFYASDTTYSFTDLNPETNYRISCRAICSSTDTSYATSVSFRTPVSCPAVTNLVPSYVSQDSITISWIPGGEETEWMVSDGINDPVTVYDTFYTFENLNPSTAYTLSVRGVCGVDDTSSLTSITVRTACGEITLPLIEDFNSYASSSFPDCWFRPVMQSPYPYLATSQAVSGNSMMFAGAATVVTPRIPIPANQIGVTFQLQKEGSNSGAIHVGWVPNPDSLEAFRTIAVINPSQEDQWLSYEVATDTLSTTDFGYICFKQVSPTTNWYYWLDNVEIYQLSTCPTPQSVYVNGVTNNSATVRWTANDEFATMKVYLGTTNSFNSAIDSVEVSGDNSYTFTNLTGSTTYYVWVQAVCSDDVSRMAQTSFTTAVDCAAPTNLAVSMVDFHAFALAWDAPTVGNEATRYRVSYKADSASTWIEDSTTNTFFYVNGLTEGTIYNYRVTTVCDEENSQSLTGSVVTTQCGIVGNNDGQASYYPTYTYYNYSYTQQLYLASDFAGMGDTITGISFKHEGTSSISRTIQIYLGNTDQASFTSTSNYVPVSDLNLVYSGSVNFGADQWVHITFDSAFVRDGRNVVVATVDNTGSYSSGHPFAASATATNRGIYFYQDGGMVSPANPSADNQNVTNYVNQVMFDASCDIPACDVPAIFVTEKGVDYLDITWLPESAGTIYTVSYRSESDTAWTVASNAVSTNSYLLENLNPGLNYSIEVSFDCQGTTLTGSIAASTACGPVAVPYTENFENYSGYYARNCWTVGTTASTVSQNTYPCVVSLTGDPNKLLLLYQGGYVIMPQISVPLNQLQIRYTLVQGGENVPLLFGLMNDPSDTIMSMHILDTIVRSDLSTESTVNITYRFDDVNDTAAYIAFWSKDGVDYSFLDNIVVEYIPTCAAPTELAASNVTATAADISWTGSAANYILEYGERNFELGTGTRMNVAGTSVNLASLIGGITYDVYVYGICGTDTSTASNRLRFTTTCDVLTLPYVQNFENVSEAGVTEGPLPNCWNYVMTTTESYYAPEVPTTYYTTYSGETSSPDHCLWLYGTSITVLPEMPVSVGNLMLSFYEYNSYPTSYKLVIGAVDSITPGFEESFVAIDTVEYSGAYQYNHLFFLNNYTGNARYLAFKNYNSEGYGYSYHYIDDIVVDSIPSCIFPYQLSTVSATTTTADITWTTCQANDYEYEYGPVGFTRGTGTTGTCTGMVASITGLTIGTSYDIYVRGICGVGDTSDWSACYTFHTLNADPVSTFPYYCDFTDTTLTNCGFELVNGTQANPWYVGAAASNGNANALYVSNDGGVSNSYNSGSTSHTYAYRDILVPGGEFIFAFDWKAEGESDYYDYLRAFLAPISYEPVAGELPNGITSCSSFNDVTPSGWIALDGGYSLNQNGSSWTTEENIVNIPAGAYRLLFIWTNDGSAGSQPPAAIDNIEIVQNTCPQPQNIVADAYMNSMTVSWTDTIPGLGWEVEYGERGFTRGTGTSSIVTVPTITISSLESLTDYDFYVRHICSEEDTGRWAKAILTTAMCDGAVYAYNYDSTSTFTDNIHIPAYTLYNYSASQTIIDSADLVALDGAEISAFAFTTLSTTDGDLMYDCEVYLSHTTMSEFNEGEGVDLDSTAVRVFQGDLGYTTTGLQTFGFDTTFVWDGHSNIILTVLRHTGDWNSSPSFESVEKSGNKGFYAYDDNYDPTLSTISTFSPYNNYTTNVVAAYQLIACGAGCPTPVITSTLPTYNSAAITWSSNATDFEVSYKSVSDADYTTPVAVAASNYTLTGLTPATQYTFRVRSLCDSGAVSDWASVNFATDSLPCFVPEDLHQTAINYTSVTLDWTNGGNEQNWVVKVFNSRVGEILDTVSAHPATITGLAANEQYFATVQAACGSNLDGFSDWSDTISFTTAECVAVSNISCAEPTDSYVQISWTSNGSENAWIVEYGMPGFGQGEELGRVTATSNPYQLSLAGFDPETEYEVYVYAQCMEGLTSVPAGPASFTTRSIGISGIEGNADINIYPNPTTGSTTISVNGISGKVNVAIVDMNGREVMNSAMECDGDCEKVMNVEGLAQGAYFVRIYGEEISTIRKLIVR